MVDLMDRIDALFQQEQLHYGTLDYLASDVQRDLNSVALDQSILRNDLTSLVGSSVESSSHSGINEVWREKICEWSYQVIDHFDFEREVVAVSIHYLDRFLAKRAVNKKIFQLAAMTCLYIAIKLYEQGTVTMESMIELSRGYFTVEQMKIMELDVMRALTWNLHPPTPYCYCKHYLFLLPSAAIPVDVRHDTLELARFLSELSVIDYFFVMYRPSAVGLACILNAMEIIPQFSESALTLFVKEIARHPSLDPTRQDVAECRARLALLYAQGGYTPTITSTSEEPRDAAISPVCVSYGCKTAAAPVNRTLQDYPKATDEMMNEPVNPVS